jgi:hypothetical protein
VALKKVRCLQWQISKLNILKWHAAEFPFFLWNKKLKSFGTCECDGEAGPLGAGAL